MGNRFKQWADRNTTTRGRSARVVTQTQAVQSPVVPVQQPAPHQPLVTPAQPPPVGALAWAPPPAPTVVQMNHGMVGPHQPVPQKVSPIPTQTVIVKPDAEYGDPYERLASTLPDIAEGAGIDMSDGVDAMEYAGLPHGVSVEQWTPTARYYNGVTDRNAHGRLDQVFGRHSVAAPQVRSDRGMAANGGLSGQRVWKGNVAGGLSPIQWQPPQ